MVLAFVLQGTTSVLAGTTGSITGDVVDSSTRKPVASARVTATSPSQSSTTTTDASGRFSFVSLAPDTYTIVVAATGTYDAATISGVTVQADQSVSVSVGQPAKLKQIGSVTSRANGALVKAGTTADVYSINAVTQDKASALGGGGTLNSAWSAISSVPGVYVAPNQQGYIGAASTLSIRGGDYDQIGFELDGVPVNRAFDNYPSGPVSSLGQQELQVYTGAPAANAEANGISGYINQVIRTGTAPATRTLTLATGAPTFYGKAAFEAGGANPSRTFSYYLGAGAYNQGYRYYDQYDGASLQNTWGTPLAPCNTATISRATAPSCYGPGGQDYTNGGTTPAYVLGPFQYGTTIGQVHDSDTVVNLHFGIPRKDGNRDDVQFLFDNNFINNVYNNSTNDAGGAAFLDAIGVGTPAYADGFHFTGAPLGTILPAAYTGGGVTPYLYPDSPGGRAMGAAIAPDRRDAFTNDQSIVKLQYQHNFGTNAFLRVYGYTYYSDWLQNGPQTADANYVGPLPSQYLLDSHSRGVSAQFSDQLSPQHLLSVQGSYTTASTMRYNNAGIGQTGPVGYLVDSSNPYGGTCYNPSFGAGGTYLGTNVAAPCNQNGSYAFTLRQAYNNTVTPANTFGTCGGGACQYVLALNGIAATFNTVVPKFTAASVTDQWKPTERLNVNLGLRLDRFQFDGSDTTNGGAARVLWYNAWNLAHPANQLMNVPNQVESYDEWQPRAGFTYTLDPRTVIRASYGRYAQAPNSAFEQYNYLQANSPPKLAPFGNFGLPTTPGHPVRPSVANNYDFSYEHQFAGDTAVKLTPFLRKTQDQIQQFYLDQKTSFVSGLNVGRQTSDGIEFELDKGDFSRNGLAARLSFTYTNSYINYTKLGNGQSVVDGYNAAIASYNAYTAFCGTNPGDKRCGKVLDAGGNPIASAPCYTTGGAADPGCGAGSVANPYWNAPVQALMDPNGNYPTFSLLPGGIGGATTVTTYGAPFVSTLLVQYKKGPFAITPALQFAGGARYGVPEAMPGVSPNQCAAGLATSTSGDPRYPYGAPGGAPFDAAACAANVVIPDTFSGRFDNIGAFVAPNTIQLHTQITYEVNKRVTLVGNFANIVNRCWGGTKVPFAVNHACGYTATFGAGSGPQPIGNAYNPGASLQPLLVTPYDPAFPGFPFNMFVEARIKI